MEGIHVAGDDAMTDDTSKGVGPIAVLSVGLLATMIIGGAFASRAYTFAGGIGIMTESLNQASCERDGHIWGSRDKCVFCSAEKPEVAPTKEDIIAFVKRKRDSCPAIEHRYYAALYFVLRNRTEENWGPKELTMDVAMRELP